MSKGNRKQEKGGKGEAAPVVRGVWREISGTTGRKKGGKKGGGGRKARSDRRKKKLTHETRGRFKKMAKQPLRRTPNIKECCGTGQAGFKGGRGDSRKGTVGITIMRDKAGTLRHKQGGN